MPASTSTGASHNHTTAARAIVAHFVCSAATSSGFALLFMPLRLCKARCCLQDLCCTDEGAAPGHKECKGHAARPLDCACTQGASRGGRQISQVASGAAAVQWETGGCPRGPPLLRHPFLWMSPLFVSLLHVALSLLSLQLAYVYLSCMVLRLPICPLASGA